MSERPIIFTGESVRAILAGTKTQTRRVVRPEPHAGVRYRPGGGAVEDGHGRPISPRYGVPGDRLWVRESWWTVEREGQGIGIPFLLYDEEWEGNEPAPTAPLRPWGEFFPYARQFGHHPSIHMPRVASRITLEVTDVRVQRVQEIREEDAQAEGVAWEPGEQARNVAKWAAEQTARMRYADLWDAINGKRAPWKSNPWIWAISFKRVRP